MIYFLRCVAEERPIKIGTTWNLTYRIKELQTGNPFQLEIAGIIPRAKLTLERVIHNKFKDLKIGDKGEWFKSNHILLKFIEICTIIPTEEDLIEFRSKPPKNKL